MEAFQFEIEGNWGHFKKPETNNNPLSHDIITKTALIGLVGAVLGIERTEMKGLFPVLSKDLLYSVKVVKPVKKISYGFISKEANNPTGKGSRKSFEFLKSPAFAIILSLYEEYAEKQSQKLFFEFKKSIFEECAIYTPILGWHNCPANLYYKSSGKIVGKGSDEFETNYFFSAKNHIPTPIDINGAFRVGFDRLPTYQNDDFWNCPDKYTDMIYLDSGQTLKVNGEYYVYEGMDISSHSIVEKCYMI